MSLTTYGGLKTSVSSWTTYSDIASLVPDFVSWAHQEICRRLRATVMLTTADLSITGATIAQPTGFIAVKRLYLDTSETPDLEVVSPEIATRMNAQYATLTNPLSVAVQGTNLYFAPTFSGTPTGKLLYYKEPTALSDDADYNAVMVKYPYLYLYGALEAAYAYKEDAEMSDRYGSRFGALIEDINQRDAAAATSGPIRLNVSPATVV